MTHRVHVRLASTLGAVAAAWGIADAVVRAADEKDDRKAAADALPEGRGLAAKYRRDRGIDKDPAVVLAEDFEKGDIADLAKRWTEVSNKDAGVLAWSEDRPETSGGRRSIGMTATLGENTGGHLFAPLARGVERAFARFYVKFAKDADYVHHFVWLGGHRPPTRWPHPRAGIRPEGDDRFSVGIEPIGHYGRFPPPGAWTFYAYWRDMKISADGRYWGNCLRPVQDPVVPRDRWQCVEFMVRLNSDPAESDGDLALWLDGRLVAQFPKGVRRGPWSGMGFQLVEKGGEPFEGLRWRSTRELLVNYFWLEHYVTDHPARQNRVAKPNPVNRVWFDDVVVATEYIGPIAE